MRMPKFKIEESKDVIVTPSGLAMVGPLIAKTDLGARLDASVVTESTDPDISHSDVIFSYIGLLCQGKTAYEDIETSRNSIFYSMALGIETVPSCATMRQRMNYGSEQWKTIVAEESMHLLKQVHPVLTPCYKNLVPLDIDVSPFDNSKTKKENVSRTYKGFDGYAPIFAYAGQEGYLVNEQLRPGKTHCQKGTEKFLDKSIRNVKQLTEDPILVRLDSGNDAKANINVCLAPETRAEFIIKRNLRKESPETWLETAKEHGVHEKVRDGKDVYTGSVFWPVSGIADPVRIVFQVTERTIKADGQCLLIPDIEVETFWTSLQSSDEVVIELYHDHGTSEQFHSEIKTDIGLERFPSGKFSTNELILSLAGLAYNMLRLIGQESQKVDDAPVRKEVHRRRLRTVIQNLITMASKLVYHARQWVLKFGCEGAWLATFRRVYNAFG